MIHLAQDIPYTTLARDKNIPIVGITNKDNELAFEFRTYLDFEEITVEAYYNYGFEKCKNVSNILKTFLISQYFAKYPI